MQNDSDTAIFRTVSSIAGLPAALPCGPPRRACFSLKPGKQYGFDDVTADRGFFSLVDLVEPKGGDQPVEREPALPP
jgi:hypothetical protein